MEQERYPTQNQNLQSSQNNNKLKQALEAFGIESYFIILLLGLSLFLNYFNIIPISKDISALSFLPHQQTINLTLNKTANIPAIPTPTPYSHKIADIPSVIDNSIPPKYIPIFSPDKEQVIFEAPEGHGLYSVPNCSICNNLEIVTAGFNYKTSKLTLIGISKIDNSVHLILDSKELQKLPNISALGGSNGHFATSDWENGNTIYYVDGVEQAKYADPQRKMNITSISFNSNGTQNGYILLSDKQQTYGSVFVNGVKQPYQGRSFSFAPKGNSWAYIGTRTPNIEFLVLNGQKQNEYGHIGDDTFFGTTDSDNYVWSPNGKRIAYVGSFGIYPKNLSVVVDGKAIGGGYSIVKYLLFSPDSSRFAYGASDLNGNIEVNIDGRKISGGLGDIIEALDGIYFSPNSKRFVYSLNGFLYEDVPNSLPKKLNSNKMSINSVVFSPNSERIAYTSGQNIWVDGTQYKGYSPYRAPIFSPDSKHVAFWEGDDGPAAYTAYYLSPNSAAVLDFTKKTNVIDPYGGWLEGALLYSPARGATYSYLQPNTFATEIINTISFTPDSRYMEFDAVRGNEYWVIVIDTTTGKEVIDPNTPIPTDLPVPTYFPTSQSPTPTP